MEERGVLWYNSKKGRNQEVGMRVFWIACIMVCMVLTGCGQGSLQNETSETAITFTDDLGRTVTVDRPQRTAALLGSFAQVWMLAGGEMVG